MTKQYFAYIRVSTQKQGEKGVSLQEQRSAIEGYAQRNQLKIDRWFEERETAAKSGRPLFLQMLALMKKGKADGVLIHKIDRSARNLKDWADLGALIDRGIEVHFVNESLDLQSRGGRLSADIQAVVAADYIRNLREETRKGFYGRLKQGYYPLPAPLGYFDMGKAKAKEIDPVRAPLIRKAFELYANGEYSIETLPNKMKELGLRTRTNNPVSRSVLSRILNNVFYTGLIRLKTGETFEGIHQPIVPTELYEYVQSILRGRKTLQSKRHDYLYRKLLTCKECGFRLIGELQKVHVYYRCHTRNCSTKCIRQEDVDRTTRRLFAPLNFSSEEKSFLSTHISGMQQNEKGYREKEISAISLTLKNIDSRLMKLTDAYVDSMLDKEAFLQRREAFLLEKKTWQDRQSSLKNGGPTTLDQVNKFLEFTNSVYSQYKTGTTLERREILKIVTSNRWVKGKQLDFSLSLPFSLIANRSDGSNGAPYRRLPRTLMGIISELVKLFKEKKIKLPQWEKEESEKDSEDLGDSVEGA